MGQKIGIIGGGQLGQMLALAAVPMGFVVNILDPNPHCPASQCAPVTVGDFYDPHIVKQFADTVDIVTIELESVNVTLIDDEQCFPAKSTIECLRDKWQQKLFYQHHGVPCAKFSRIETQQEVKEVAQQWGYPLLLKTRVGAFDGRGNKVLRNNDDIEPAMQQLVGQGFYAEQWVNFTDELAVVVAKDQYGNCLPFPPVKTVHLDSICHTVTCPTGLPQSLLQQAQSLATTLVNTFDGAGVFAVEMFVTKDQQLLVNEVAPRVHNSGHLTIEACRTSQFEQHVRAITGLPLGNISLHQPAAMVNILGQRTGTSRLMGLEQALAIPNVSVHSYGKQETRPLRKMGHITALADNVTDALEHALQAAAMISI